LIPQSGQTIGMVDAELGWHLLLTTDGTESQRTIRINPAVDLPDEIHPIYGDDDLALVRATAGIDGAAHYNDDLSVSCPNGLGAGLGSIVSVPVEGVPVVGQSESITWTGTPNGASEAAVIRRHVPIAPAPHVDPAPVTPPTVADDEAETDAATPSSGNVLTNDASGLTIVAVNGLSANVGVAVAGNNGGVFTIASTGAWTFDPDGDFAGLLATQAAETSVVYHASDGVAEAAATLTVTVSSAIVSDPYWANVSICINAKGTDGSLVITEAKGKTVTLAGDTKIKTTLGFPTVYCDGAGDLFYIPYTSDMNMEAVSFTIEFSVRFLSGTGWLFTNASSYGGYYSYRLDAGGAQCFVGGLRDLSFGTSLYDGAMHHAVLQRNGTSLQLLADGTLRSSVDIGTSAMSYATGRYTVGAYHSNAFSAFHLRGFRVTKGVARYAASYTIPVPPFPEV
jgi:VCBS repeat-containing protein